MNELGQKLCFVGTSYIKRQLVCPSKRGLHVFLLAFDGISIGPKVFFAPSSTEDLSYFLIIHFETFFNFDIKN